MKHETANVQRAGVGGQGRERGICPGLALAVRLCSMFQPWKPLQDVEQAFLVFQKFCHMWMQAACIVQNFKIGAGNAL